MTMEVPLWNYDWLGKKKQYLSKIKKDQEKKKKLNLNKENTKPVDLEKETRKEKCLNIQTEACKKIDYWVAFGTKDEWLKFKTN